MYLTHATEAEIFGLFIAVYSFVSKRSSSNNALRLDDALLSSLIGFIIITVFYLYTSFLWMSELRSTNFDYRVMLSSVLPILAIAVCIYWRRKGTDKGVVAKKIIRSRTRFYLLLSTGIILVYLFGFLTWFFIEDFKTSSVSDIGFTPWFIYPLMLGIVGLFAIISLRYMSNILPNNSVAMI